MKTTKPYWKPSWTWLISWGLIDDDWSVDWFLLENWRMLRSLKKFHFHEYSDKFLEPFFPSNLPYLVQKAEFLMQTLPHQLHRQVSFTLPSKKGVKNWLTSKTREFWLIWLAWKSASASSVASIWTSYLFDYIE